MYIVQNGPVYEVSFNWEQSIVEAIKKIPGRQFDGARKIWTVPVSEEQRLQSLYAKYLVKSQANAPIKIGVIPDLPFLEEKIPLVRPLYGPQERGAAFCLKHQRVIIGDEPGTGKTSQAIAAAVASGQFPVLVICPSTLKRNWKTEWMMVAGRKAAILDDTNRHNWHRFIEEGICDVFITNFESVKKFFVTDIRKEKDKKGKTLPMRVRNIEYHPNVQLFKLIIVDELHRLKEIKNQTTKFVVGITSTKEWVFGLTGTPIMNKTIDLLAQLFVINQMHLFGGMDFFVERYTKSKTYLQELHYRLKTTCFYQRKKEEVLKDLPPKIRQKTLVDITNRDEYQAALDDLAKYLQQYKDKSDDEVQKSMAGEIMVRIGICKDISARGKLQQVCQEVDDLIEQGQKVIIFIHQKSVADELVSIYPDAVTVRGVDSEAQRERNIKAFQTNPRVNKIICSIKAGGVGTTLTAGSWVLMVELPWNAATSDQCEDRAHRDGQKNNVFIKYFLGYNTIDEQIYELIQEKRALAGDITGNKDVTQHEVIDRITASLFSAIKK